MNPDVNVTGLIVMLLLWSVGMICLGAALVVRKNTPQPKQPDPEETNEILVKRVRPSFRHPGKTSISSYDPYKQSNGLYATIRQGKGNTADEVDKN